MRVIRLTCRLPPCVLVVKHTCMFMRCLAQLEPTVSFLSALWSGGVHIYIIKLLVPVRAGWPQGQTAALSEKEIVSECMHGRCAWCMSLCKRFPGFFCFIIVVMLILLSL
jgi:hypothetical protein